MHWGSASDTGLVTAEPGGASLPAAGQAARGRLNVANILTLLRLLSVPALVWLAWTGGARPFLYLLILAMATDVVDGQLARWRKQTSTFGTQLDSAADALLYVVLPVCLYWLKPEFVHAEAALFGTVVVSYVLPTAVGFIRFHRLPSYHTYGARLSSLLLAGALLSVLADGPLLLFYLAAPVRILTGIEELAITLVIPTWRPQVPSIRHALAYRRRLLSKRREA